MEIFHILFLNPYRSDGMSQFAVQKLCYVTFDFDFDIFTIYVLEF